MSFVTKPPKRCSYSHRASPPTALSSPTSPFVLAIQYFRWGWLKFLRQLGSKQARDAINMELDAMKEIGREQQGPARNTAAATTTTTTTEGQPEHGDAGGMGEGGVLGLSRRVAEAVDIKGLLEQNTDEVHNLIRALDGSYIKPGVGGEAARRCSCSESREMCGPTRGRWCC